jgi:hypothetical protein
MAAAIRQRLLEAGQSDDSASSNGESSDGNNMGGSINADGVLIRAKKGRRGKARVQRGAKGGGGGELGVGGGREGGLHAQGHRQGAVLSMDLGGWKFDDSRPPTPATSPTPAVI